MRITHLQTNHVTNPVGYQPGRPVLTWDVEGAAGKRQTEAAIQVFEGEHLLLDTGFSADISSLGYEADIPLKPRTRYFWQVTVRTDAGEEATGDMSILRAQFDSMKAWVDWIAREDGNDHGWRRHFHYGDWLALDNPALHS